MPYRDMKLKWNYIILFILELFCSSSDRTRVMDNAIHQPRLSMCKSGERRNTEQELIGRWHGHFRIYGSHDLKAYMSSHYYILIIQDATNSIRLITYLYTIGNTLFKYHMQWLIWKIKHERNLWEFHYFNRFINSLKTLKKINFLQKIKIFLNWLFNRI